MKFINQILLSVVLRVLQDNSDWIFETYKSNVLSTLWITIYYYYGIFFYLMLQFSSSLFDYWFSYRDHPYTESTQQVCLPQDMRCFFSLILQCSFLSIILITSHKGKWFPFSFHIGSAIPDFSISPRTTAFRPSSRLTFRGWHGMEYTQFLVMYSVGGLTRKRYLRRVVPLLNIVNII